jgi:hypothetical protein
MTSEICPAPRARHGTTGAHGLAAALQIHRQSNLCRFIFRHKSS